MLRTCRDPDGWCGDPDYLFKSNVENKSFLPSYLRKIFFSLFLGEIFCHIAKIHLNHTHEDHRLNIHTDATSNISKKVANACQKCLAGLLTRELNYHICMICESISYKRGSAIGLYAALMLPSLSIFRSAHTFKWMESQKVIYINVSVVTTWYTQSILDILKPAIH